MNKDSSLVKRLIAFLKKPEALAYPDDQPVQNVYDDYQPQATAPAPVQQQERILDYNPPDYAHDYASADPQVASFMHSVAENTQAPIGASRLDALVMRAVQQFHAQVGYVIRQSSDGRMTYCTGRDQQGRYIAHSEVDVDRRALFLALDSGESQLFVQSDDVDTPGAVLCGPLWVNNRVIGVLYLDSPARSRLHRGIFDVFCDQAARMLAEGVA